MHVAVDCSTAERRPLRLNGCSDRSLLDGYEHKPIWLNCVWLSIEPFIACAILFDDVFDCGLVEDLSTKLGMCELEWC
jgi:hypothetical protein